MTELKNHLRLCLEKLKTNKLIQEDLEDALEKLESVTNKEFRQSLLYVQASSSNLDADIIGMSIHEKGRHPEDVCTQDSFIYHSVFDAVQNGWRIIKFPEMALALDEQNNYCLGFEFILERWR